MPYGMSTCRNNIFVSLTDISFNHINNFFGNLGI